MFDRDRDSEEPLNDLERRLRSWEPAPDGLDRDRMLFEAGRAAAQRPADAGTAVRLWKLATAAAVLLALGLGQGWRAERSQRQALELSLAARAASPTDPDITTPRPEPTRTEVDPSSYLALARWADPRNDASLSQPPGDAKAVSHGDPRDARSGTPLRPHDFDRVLSL